MQLGAVFVDYHLIDVELPDADEEVIPGVPWGPIEAFPSPAYWAYQVVARRHKGNAVNYKLGNSLKEEVGACLLGGHGIPARVGLAAFSHLKAQRAFSDPAPTEEQLHTWLTMPLTVDGRSVHYRFARQKAKYLAAAFGRLNEEKATVHSGVALRNWLLSIPGIGLKTASWIARNWLDADDVAILDVHLLRAGILAGFFPLQLRVERDYLELEKRFLEFSRGLDVRPSELDAVIWLEMMSSPKTVRALLSRVQETQQAASRRTSRARSQKSHADASKRTFHR